MEALLPYVADMAHAVRFKDHVVLGRQVVRLGDVADLSDLPMPLQVASQDLPVVRSANSHLVTISSSELSARVRRLMPAMGPWLVNAKVTNVVVEFAPAAAISKSASNNTGGCVVVQHAITAGEIVGLSDVKSAPCQTTGREFSYDVTTGLARARRDLQAGEVCGPIAAAALAAIKPGQEVTLRSQVGAVSVQRIGVVVWPARPNGKVMVQTKSGPPVQVDMSEIAQ